jgi:hypothetical protein
MNSLTSEEVAKDIIYGINRDPYKAAEELGLVVVLPTDCQLQLDIDTEIQYQSFQKNLTKMKNDTGFVFYDCVVRPSKSGLPKRHITLTSSEPMGVWQRIALQYYLQSDAVREGLNCMRVLLKDPFPIAFFEVPETHKPVVDPHYDLMEVCF